MLAAERDAAALLPWWRAVAADFRFCREICGGRTSQALASYGLYVVIVYRMGRAIHHMRVPVVRWLLLIPYHVLRVLTELAFGISMARTADVGVPVMFHHFGGVFVAAGSTVGRWCQIYHGVTIGESGGSQPGRPMIGDRVLIGAGAKVLGRVRVGDGARIGANAVVLSDVPPGALAAGVPATVRNMPHAE